MDVVMRAASSDVAGNVAASPVQCRCPVRPYYSMGSLASGSAHEVAIVERWENEHGSHRYAQARDELSRALQRAETAVRSGSAVLDMVHDVFGLARRAEQQATR